MAINYGSVEYPFAALSKMIPYSPKQIADHWWNALDPRISKVPFSKEEKDFIYAWVEKYSKPQDTIQWKDLQPIMEAKFGKFRSRNDLKNVWNAKKRRIKRINRVSSEVNSISPDDEYEYDEGNENN
ncbi:15057_t:CDS:2 [Funneliformis mosseae]|uniref:15057_t:CDS:1 n=1 Tax=Funneliformis mosseae TaxID=27381 RepID=A0A9N9H464_FUNMO|nr:15057_t:CDS:2 [Funneliformis mosseae]